MPNLFEDNASNLQLDKLPSINPVGKFIDVKYHCLRENIQHGECTAERIDRGVHKVDIFTKVLQGEISLKIKKLLCGWSI